MVGLCQCRLSCKSEAVVSFWMVSIGYVGMLGNTKSYVHLDKSFRYMKMNFLMSLNVLISLGLPLAKVCCFANLEAISFWNELWIWRDVQQHLFKHPSAKCFIIRNWTFPCYLCLFLSVFRPAYHIVSENLQFFILFKTLIHICLRKTFLVIIPSYTNHALFQIL